MATQVRDLDEVEVATEAIFSLTALEDACAGIRYGTIVGDIGCYGDWSLADMPDVIVDRG